jgi:hypothetical protein
MASGQTNLERRTFLAQLGRRAAAISFGGGLLHVLDVKNSVDAGDVSASLRKNWLAQWEKAITSDMRNRYCDREMGEELGWLVSPFLNGFYDGYQATHDVRWIERLIDWADAWIARAVKEPDGFLGWPKADGASTRAMPSLFTDNILGEAMAFRPVVLMASVILATPKLRSQHGKKSEQYLELAQRTFAKWRKRGCWREVSGGGLWAVAPFGIDQASGRWTNGYGRRESDGFSLPDNKQNHVALWLLAMHEATKERAYRDCAEKWWRLMKSRIHTRSGKYAVWNYWEPAGPWDYKPDGSPKHWVGVHPNGGYYAIDVQGIVAAFRAGLVFTKADIERLAATNRDFMWNHQIRGAKFQRIDGGKPDPRWAKTPGVLWMDLAPYDATLQSIFEANHEPGGWGGLAATPRYLAELFPA